MWRKCEYPQSKPCYMEDLKGRLIYMDSLPIFAGSRPDRCPVDIFAQEVRRGMAAMDNVPKTRFEFTPRIFAEWIASAFEGEAVDHFNDYVKSGGLYCPHALLDSITRTYGVPKRVSASLKQPAGRCSAIPVRVARVTVEVAPCSDPSVPLSNVKDETIVKQRIGRRSAIPVRVAPPPVLSTSPPVPAVSKRHSSIPVRMSLGQYEETDFEWDEDVPLPTFLHEEPPALVSSPEGDKTVTARKDTEPG